MWLTVLKAALIVFIAAGVITMIIVGRRRSRANRGDPRWTYRAQQSHLGAIQGLPPATPLPEWVYWDEACDPDDPR